MKITKEMNKALAKAKKTSYWVDYEADKVTHPYTHHEADLSGPERSLYLFLKEWYLRRWDEDYKHLPLELTDEDNGMLHRLFMALRPDDYEGLIDA